MEGGFTERKICLVLDLYDLIKQVKKQSKVAHKLAMKDPRWEHPCDLAVKEYAVVDHSAMTHKQIQFNINATLLKTSLTIKAVKSVAVEEQQSTEHCDSKDE